MRKILASLLVVISVPLLAAQSCQTTRDIGVELATLGYVRAAPETRAPRVIAAVQLTAAILETRDYATIPLLESAVIGALRLDQADPFDAAVARRIIGLVSKDLLGEAPYGLLNEPTVVRLQELLAIIESGARAYMPPDAPKPAGGLLPFPPPAKQIEERA